MKVQKYLVVAFLGIVSLLILGSIIFISNTNQQTRNTAARASEAGQNRMDIVSDKIVVVSSIEPPTITREGSSRADITVTIPTTEEINMVVELRNPNKPATEPYIFQEVLTNQAMTSNVAKKFEIPLTRSPQLALGQYVVKVGIFSADWSKLLKWVDFAGSLTIQEGQVTPAPTSNSATAAIARVSGDNYKVTARIRSATTVTGAIIVKVLNGSGATIYTKIFPNVQIPANTELTLTDDTTFTTSEPESSLRTHVQIYKKVYP